VNEHVAYPDTWPRLVEASGCAPIAGTYVNRSVQTTLWKSPKNPDVGVEYLSRLITRDAMRTTVKAEVITQVKLDLAQKSLTYRLGESWTVDNHFPAQALHCTAQGRWVLVFDDPSQSEGTLTDRARSQITLSTASDGSLIAQDSVETHGMLGKGGHFESWMRFARAE
jgi:hypothetical protein